MKNWVWTLSLLTISFNLGLIAHAQNPDPEDTDSDADTNSELISESITQDANNPLAPYAIKANGKVKNKFKVPYSAMVKYFELVGHGSIIESKNPVPLLNLEMKPITDETIDQVKFYANLKKGKLFPLRLLSPDTVSSLFTLDPKAYIKNAEADDFLTAKRNVYSSANFNFKKLAYTRDFLHLEDWRGLNHPPVKDLGDDLTVWDKDYTPIDYEKRESNFYKEEFQHHLDEVTSTELTFGNKIHLLANGNSYQNKLAEIRKAKKSVLMAVMSFFCDSSSRELEDLLIQKVKEGVDVKLMVEKVWTELAMKKCMRRMKDGGVDVALANDLLKKGEASALFHNKYMIIDNSTVIMGGSNIVESDNVSTGYNHMNRDNDVLVTGPIATEAMLAYIPLWKKYRGEKNEFNQDGTLSSRDISNYETLALAQKAEELKAKQRGSDNYASILNDPKARNQGVCRFVSQSPDTDKHKLTKAFMEYINNAQERMNMTTGSIMFELPDDSDKEKSKETYNKELFKSIFAATDRGVKLDLIGNGIDGGYGEISNSLNRLKTKIRFSFEPIHRLFYSIMANLMNKSAAKKNQPYLEYIQNKPNARAWTNFEYMHAKLMQIDRVASMISSYNLESWSGDKSHETGIICLDESLSHEMDRSFLRDFANSLPAATEE